MNKSELIDAIAEKGGLSTTDAGKALDANIASIGEALKKGDTVTLVGLGTLSVKDRAARTGRNPKTGEELQIKASKVPSFKAGKGLKDSVAQWTLIIKRAAEARFLFIRKISYCCDSFGFEYQLESL